MTPAAASAIGEGIASIPEEQAQGAFALMQGADYAYDPETGETSTFDPLLLPATTALGTAASIARVADDGSAGFLGSWAVGVQHLCAKKEKKFNKAKSGSFFRYPADDREAFDRTKGYIEPSDGKFRFEIDTSNAKLSKAWTKSKRTVTGEGTEDNPEFYYSIDFAARMQKGKAFDTPTLGELIDFPELFKEYPDLAGMKVRQLPPRDVARRVGAAYDGEKDEIYIGPGSRKTLMSNILHEIQHAVQKREGFTRGTSPASYLPDNHYENLAALQKSSRAEAQDLGKKFNMGPYKVVQAAKAFRQFGPGLDFSGSRTETPSAYFDFSKVADDLKRLSQLVDDEETIMDMQSAIIQANRVVPQTAGRGRGSYCSEEVFREPSGTRLRNPLNKMAFRQTRPQKSTFVDFYNLESQELAEGGVVGMVDVARDMTRGPRGVESLVPVARNMNRSMLG